MDSNDPINEVHKNAGECARTGLLLIRKLEAEGWLPEAIEEFASDRWAAYRTEILDIMGDPLNRPGHGVLEW